MLAEKTFSFDLFSYKLENEIMKFEISFKNFNIRTNSILFNHFLIQMLFIKFFYGFLIEIMFTTILYQLQLFTK